MAFGDNGSRRAACTLVSQESLLIDQIYCEVHIMSYGRDQWLPSLETHEKRPDI
jgi:hypothetical protein